MRAIGVCILWVIVAVACTALVIVIYEAFTLTQAGQRVGIENASELFSGLGAYQVYLYYAAGIGLILALVSMIPAVVRQNAERVFFWGIFGAISGAFSLGCAVFLFKGFQLFQAGVRADSISFVDLLTKEMEIASFLPFGAIAGAGIAVAMVFTSIMRASEAEQAAAARYSSHLNDPDTMIRTQRAQRAQQYLAERRQRAPAAGAESA